MKHLNSLMVALTLLMGVVFTSCLDTDGGDRYEYRGCIVKVTGYMGLYSFKSEGGITITPTQASIAAIEARGFKMSDAEGKVAQIAYRWDPEQLTIPTDTKDVQGVELYSIEVLDNTVEIVEEKGASNDSISVSNNAPIISMETQPSDGYDVKYVPQFFLDDYTLLLPINYYISNKRHYLTLVYYPNEDNGSTLRFYLGHNTNGDDATTNTTSYYLTANTYGNYGVGLFYKAYNIRGAIEHYMHKTGNEYPTTVEIVAKVNEYSLKLDDSQTKEEIYTVTKKTEE